MRLIFIFLYLCFLVPSPLLCKIFGTDEEEDCEGKGGSEKDGSLMGCINHDN